MDLRYANRDMFAPQNRPKFEALVETYFRKGGCQLMVTALNRGDLEDAMEHPENYPDLLVRVAGWTSRFVELPDYARKEVLERTLHG
jgi:pyruvate-formate lyase